MFEGAARKKIKECLASFIYARQLHSHLYEYYRLVKDFSMNVRSLHIYYMLNVQKYYNTKYKQQLCNLFIRYEYQSREQGAETHFCFALQDLL